MSLTFKNKELYFTKDLSKYVAHEPYNANVEINAWVGIFLAFVHQDNKTPENIKKSIASLLTFINANSSNSRYYHYSSSYLQLTSTEDSFFKSLAVSEQSKNIIKSTLERINQEGKFELFVHDISSYSSLSNANDTKISTVALLKEKPALRNLMGGTSYLFKDKIKVAVLNSATSLTDSTTNTVHEPLNPHMKIGKALTNLDEILVYLKTLKPEESLSLLPFSKSIGVRALSTLSKEEQGKLNQSLNYRNHSYVEVTRLGLAHTLETTVETIRGIRENIDSVYKDLLKQCLNFDDFIKKPWTGSLNEEEVFNFGKAFYILGTEKNVEGFVGLKSIYNRGNSNSYTYTVVKDLKNACLFTEGAQYSLGYGLTETERLYVDMEFKHLSDRKSKLSHKLQAFIDKNKINDALGAMPEIVPSEEATPKPRSKNKI